MGKLQVCHGSTICVREPKLLPSIRRLDFGPGFYTTSLTIQVFEDATEEWLDFVIDKARQQPEKVKIVLDKMKTDGILTMVDAVRSKLAQPLPLGYCNVGVVAEEEKV